VVDQIPKNKKKEDPELPSRRTGSFFILSDRMANSLKSLMKTGFGLGLGLFASQVVFVALGLALFIPGLIMVRNARAEDKNTTSGSYVGGMVLLVLGVILMGGFGLGAVIDNL
jgi:hypothetical protein